MYLAVPRGTADADRLRTMNLAVRSHGGLVLLALRSASVVALDDADAEQLRRDPLVGSLQGVTLNPRGVAAERLQAVFAENIRRQLQPPPIQHTSHEEQP